MAQLNKIDIPVASVNKTKLNLSSDHVTSMSFMQLQPVFYRHMIKGEHLNFDAFAQVRPAPLAVPTYGRCRLNLRGFVVPYREVFPNWNEFYADTLGSNYGNTSLVSSPPRITSQDIFEFFDPDENYGVSFIGDASHYDFYYDGKWICLNSFGRYCYKILYSLGYDFLGYASKDGLQFNALALLAYFKVFYDWYANSQYLDNSDLIHMLQILKYNDPTSYKRINATDLDCLFRSTQKVLYDTNGYFEAAWDNPVSPTSNQFSVFNILDITGNSSNMVSTVADGTPVMIQSNASNVDIGTTYLHSALKRLTDYQKRHALAGARPIERILAQFGIQTDYLKMQRSIYVGSQSIDINIGSVMATANGSDGVNTSSVGDYAGAGYGSGNKSWDFQCDEECIFIVMATIQPSGGYYQGYDRNNRHLRKTDFFNPEFDGLGVQVLEKGEVFVSRKDDYTGVDGTSLYADKFAFTGRYGEYKRSLSRVSGDISFPRIFAGGDSWHLMRELTPTIWLDDIANCTHSEQFTTGLDAFMFNRIFQYQGSDFDEQYDTFYCDFHFDVGSYCPCRPLFDTYDFEEEGKEITLASNGATLN